MGFNDKQRARFCMLDFSGFPGNGQFGLMDVGEQNTNHQESELPTTQLYRVFGCSHYSPVDCREEDGVFVLERKCHREKAQCAG
jgi:hypothetical protein